jgi:hypothetical protein
MEVNAARLDSDQAYRTAHFKRVAEELYEKIPGGMPAHPQEGYWVHFHLETSFLGKEEKLIELIKHKYPHHLEADSDPDDPVDDPSWYDDEMTPAAVSATDDSRGELSSVVVRAACCTVVIFAVYLLYDLKLTVGDNLLQLYLHGLATLSGAHYGSDLLAGSAALDNLRELYQHLPAPVEMDHHPDTHSVLIPRASGGDIHVLLMSPPDFAGKAAQIMSAADVDGDGQLSLEEYTSFLQPGQPEPPRKHPHHESDSDAHSHSDQYYQQTTNGCWCKELTAVQDKGSLPSCVEGGDSPAGHAEHGWCDVRPGCQWSISAHADGSYHGWDKCAAPDARPERAARPPPLKATTRWVMPSVEIHVPAMLHIGLLMV